MSQSRTNQKNATKHSTSIVFTYLKATFKSPESHPEAQPMKEFFKGIETAINLVRAKLINADEDPAFKKAADIFSKLTPECQNMESLPPSRAAALMQNWIKSMRDIGTNSVMEVQGEPSKLLAQEYADLLTKLINKEFWPIASPRISTEYLPKGFPEVGPSYATVYAVSYADFNAEKMKKSVEILQQRITDYNHQKAEKDPNAAADVVEMHLGLKH